MRPHAILNPMPLVDPTPRLANDPKSVKINLTAGTGMEIEWKDGHRSSYTFKFLRDACPCALCEDERVKAGRKPGEAPTLPHRGAAHVQARGQAGFRGRGRQVRAAFRVERQSRPGNLFVGVSAGSVPLRGVRKDARITRQLKPREPCRSQGESDKAAVSHARSYFVFSAMVIV